MSIGFSKYFSGNPPGQKKTASITDTAYSRAVNHVDRNQIGSRLSRDYILCKVETYLNHTGY